MIVVVWLLECANTPGMDDKCEAMARLGQCNIDRSLLDTCKLSCTRCAPLPSNVSGMLPYLLSLRGINQCICLLKYQTCVDCSQS